MLSISLAGISLAIWIYLALGRGGFWRVSKVTSPAANPHKGDVDPVNETS